MVRKNKLQNITDQRLMEQGLQVKKRQRWCIHCHRPHQFRLTYTVHLFLLMLWSICLNTSKVVTAAQSSECTFCIDGSSIPKPDKIVRLMGLEMTCSFVEDYFPVYAPSRDSENCRLVQQLGSVCGCEKPLGEDSCDICIDGSNVEDPLHELPEYEALFSGFKPNCDLMQSFMHSTPRTSQDCRQIQNNLGERCGCSQVALDELQDTNMAIEALQGFFTQNGTNSTMILNNTMNNISTLFPLDNSTLGDIFDNLIPLGKLSTLDVALFGSKTKEEVYRQHRVFRAAATLSILGTILVILDNFLGWRQGSRSTTQNNSKESNASFIGSSNPNNPNYNQSWCCVYVAVKKIRENNYNQIIVAMAIADLILSVSMVFMNAPKPVDEESLFEGEKGAHGNDTTCLIQGLARQFGSITSLSFNAVLSTYYLLIIVFNSKKSRLKRMQSWFLVVPILLGVVLTCGSIPFVEPALVGCHIMPPSDSGGSFFGDNDNTQNWPFYGLYMIPAFGVMAYATFCMVVVGIHIHRVEKRSQKYDFARSVRMKNSYYAQNYTGNMKNYSNAVGVPVTQRSTPSSTNSSLRNSLRESRIKGSIRSSKILSENVSVTTNSSQFANPQQPQEPPTVMNPGGAAGGGGKRNLSMSNSIISNGTQESLTQQRKGSITQSVVSNITQESFVNSNHRPPPSRKISMENSVASYMTNNTNSTYSTRKRQQAYSKNSLKGKVMFQCSLYLIALYLSWIPYLSLTMKIKSSREVLQYNYSLWTFSFFLLPLQGFLNAVVYFKRRIARQLYTWYRIFQEQRELRLIRKEYEAYAEYYYTAGINQDPAAAAAAVAAVEQNMYNTGRRANIDTSLTSVGIMNPPMFSQSSSSAEITGPSTELNTDTHDQGFLPDSTEEDSNYFGTDIERTSALMRGVTPRFSNRGDRVRYKIATAESEYYDRSNNEDTRSDVIRSEVKEEEFGDVVVSHNNTFSKKKKKRRNLIDDDESEEFNPPPIPQFSREKSLNTTTTSVSPSLDSLSPSPSQSSQNNKVDDSSGALGSTSEDVVFDVNDSAVEVADAMTEKRKRKCKPLVSTPNEIPLGTPGIRAAPPPAGVAIPRGSSPPPPGILTTAGTSPKPAKAKMSPTLSKLPPAVKFSPSTEMEPSRPRANTAELPPSTEFSAAKTSRHSSFAALPPSSPKSPKPQKTPDMATLRRRERRRRRRARERRPSMKRFNEPIEDLMHNYGESSSGSSSSSSDSDKDKDKGNENTGDRTAGMTEHRFSLSSKNLMKRKKSFGVSLPTKTALNSNKSSFSYFLKSKPLNRKLSPHPPTSAAEKAAAVAAMAASRGEEGELQPMMTLQEWKQRRRHHLSILEESEDFEPTEQLLEYEDNEDDLALPEFERKISNTFHEDERPSHASMPNGSNHLSEVIPLPTNLRKTKTTFSYFLGRQRRKEEQEQKKIHLRRRSQDNLKIDLDKIKGEDNNFPVFDGSLLPTEEEGLPKLTKSRTLGGFLPSLGTITGRSKQPQTPPQRRRRGSAHIPSRSSFILRMQQGNAEV